MNASSEPTLPGLGRGEAAATPVGVGRLAVASMCHCDDPTECDDHWEFYVDPVMAEDGEHVRRARTLTPSQMRWIADLVEQAGGLP